MTTGSQVVMDVDSMQEGARLHRKIQKAQDGSYHSEVPLKKEWSLPDYKLVLEGRADGIEVKGDECLIDEIKCVHKDVNGITEAELLHLAQAKCYACIYGQEHDLEEISIQITYCNIETEEIKRITDKYSMKGLSEWFDALYDEYKTWADLFYAMRQQREQSAKDMTFPFEFRPGQKTMTALVYQTLKKRKSVFLQAPTGIGKTISTIYPTIKVMSQGEVDRIFYLTAKTITRTVAEGTIRLLKKEGLSFHSVTITAKEKICVNDTVECDYRTCPRAEGHYDRINEALYQMLTEETEMTREVILLYAKKFQVCPYQLAFEAAAWADFVICDYNYVYDPHVNRSSLFGENISRTVFLVDEAHNLLDRARDMYSADLLYSELSHMKRLFQKRDKKIARKLGNVMGAWKRLLCEEPLEEYVLLDNSDPLYFPIYRLLEPMGDYITDHPEDEEQEEIMDCFFRIRHFYQMLEEMERGYQIYWEKVERTQRIVLFCVDPSQKLEEYIEGSFSSIFFSATLLPIEYFKKLIGGDQVPAYSIPSPFDRDKRLLAITRDVTSRYKMRGPDQYDRMITYVIQTVKAHKGNYMVFFPSYQMVRDCMERDTYQELTKNAKVTVQESSMTEEEREDFLSQFRKDSDEPLVGMCVLGSFFSEGIDLAGDRLIGVMIIGTGIPQVCTSREIIRTYFDQNKEDGYEYAYRYPGMNKVLQAAGRVIRTMEDRGIILLMDERFLYPKNQYLLPEDWDQYYQVNLTNYTLLLDDFWKISS
ncbi:MAG: ATP-dependent DNA helicase [Lachnospiraceae bacterium]|nr:ATP-dependent DNA helicase [Lachnospiraceae bacterium]